MILKNSTFILLHSEVQYYATKIETHIDQSNITKLDTETGNIIQKSPKQNNRICRYYVII